MKKIKTWTCDYEKCLEVAEWYRRWKGELLKLCTKHEAYMRREHLGRSVKESELDSDDIQYLWEKEAEKTKKKGTWKKENGIWKFYERKSENDP